MAQLPNNTSRITPENYEVSRVQDNVTRVVDAILSFLNALFSYNSKTKVLTVAASTVAVNNLTATSATIGTLTSATTVPSITTTTLTVSGASNLNTIVATGTANLAAVVASGAITGASYSGGAISGTTGNFSGNVGVTGAITGASYSGGPISGTTLNTSGLATLNSANVTNNSTVGSSTVTGNETVGGTLGVTGVTTLTGGLNANGGVLAGSRVCGLKGTVGQNSLSVNGTYGVQAFGAGSTAGPITTFHVPTRAGCIAAISAKIYNAVATAGTISIASVGATTNINTGAFGYTLVNNTYTQTFAFGSFPYTAGSQIGLNVTSSGWVQASGTTGIELTLWVYE